MRKPIETWEQLQDKASSLIYTTGRLKQELADLKRYKHHLTGRSLDDQDRPRREEEVAAKQKELERTKTALELTKQDLQLVEKPK
jgi:hypothetical protein